MSLKPNDVVFLNCGGPFMTVSEMRDEETAVCVWFDGQHHMQCEAFWASSLVPAFDEGGNLRPGYAPFDARPKPSSDRMAAGE